MLISWGRVLPHFCCLLVCPGEAVPWLHNGFKFMAKWSRKPASWLTLHSQHPCSYAWEQCSTLMPPILLCPEKPCCHSQQHSQQGNSFFLCNLGDSHTILSTPRSPLSFTIGALLRQAWPQKWQNSETNILLSLSEIPCSSLQKQRSPPWSMHSSYLPQINSL